jgi:hypothetical protein
MKLYRSDLCYNIEAEAFKALVYTDRFQFQEIDASNVFITVRLDKGLGRGDDQIKKFQEPYTNILNGFGVPHGSDWAGLVKGLNGGLDVNVQDQTTPAVIIPFHNIHATTTVATTLVTNTRTIEVADASGAAAGDLMLVYSAITAAFSKYYVVSKLGNVVTVDSLIDVPMGVGSDVDFASDNMAVDGSVTPVVFGIRGAGITTAVDAEIDLTRIFPAARTDTAVDLAKFADITRLTNGLLIRKRTNGSWQNIFNFKSNGELAAACYDWNPYLSTNPQQGQDGFISRLTFAGPSKIGVVLRMLPGDDVEIVVQDNLLAIDKYSVMMEGHVTNPF